MSKVCNFVRLIFFVGKLRQRQWQILESFKSGVSLVVILLKEGLRCSRLKTRMAVTGYKI